MMADENSMASLDIICLGGQNRYITLKINASATVCAILSLSGTAIVKFVSSQVITNNKWYPPNAYGIVLMSIDKYCMGA